MLSQLQFTSIRAAVVAVLLLGWQTVFSSPSAIEHPSFATQPNGDVIDVVLRGNADSSWYETEDGYLIDKDEQGNWIYVQNNPHLAKSVSQVTPLIVGQDDPQQAGLQKYKRATRHFHAHHSMNKAVSGGNPITSKLGEVPMLVILGYYDDALSAANCSTCATTDSEYIQQLFFADGTQQNSVADFFATASKGGFTMSAVQETHGTVNDGVVGWLRLGDVTPQATAMSTSSYKSNRIAADAMNEAMHYVDFTQYDKDNDGWVETNELGITIILGGYEASYGRDENNRSISDDTSSPRVWGQSRSFSSSSGVSVPRQTVSGKTVRINTSSNGMTYSIVGERHGNHPLTMGIITHEIGHTVFDLPDLYDTIGSSHGIGGWSLMGFGSWGKARSESYPGATPVMLDAWSRLALGWVTPTNVSYGELASVSADNMDVYRIPTANAYEYFLIENRRYQGYDQGLHYFLYTTDFGGLAVWHIDDAVGTQNVNNDNANVHRKRVDLVAASGDESIDAGTSYAHVNNLFNADNISEFSAQTHDDLMLYSGGDSGISVVDISYADVSMSFTAYSSSETSQSNTNIGNTQNVNLSQVSSGSGGGGGGAFYGGLLLLLVLALKRTKRF